MKLFKSKKEKKVQPPSDNQALEELINDMPSSTPKKTPAPSMKAKKSLFGRKKTKKHQDAPLFIDDNEAGNGNETGNDSMNANGASDDFLASLESKPKQGNQDILKWLLGGLFILLALLVFYFLYTTFIANDDADNAASATQTPILSAEAEPVLTPEAQDTTDQQVEPDASTLEATDPSTDTTELVIQTLEDIPDPEAIISAEMPENEVMAKEEIDRLADEAAQLEEQGKLIADQVAMMDELTDKKEEQIALLEQQIALLEAQKNSQ